MADGNLPAPGRRIDRAALEKIIQRAAELQAGEMDTGENMTEAEVLKLGAEVGIDGRHLRQALYEQGAGSVEESGLLARIFGGRHVSAGRVVAGEKAAVEAALADWMANGEAMAVKRRLPDRTVWERQRGFFAEVKRGFGVGGRQYRLSRAVDVTVVVTQLEAGFCHVELSADMSNLRSAAIAGTATVSGVTGLMGTTLLAVSQAPWPITMIALVPLGAAVLAPVLGGRMQKKSAAHMQLALEQVLDRLEAGEIKPSHRDAPGALFNVAVELRKAITESVEATRRNPRRLPPNT